MWQSANMHRSLKIWNWRPGCVLMSIKLFAHPQCSHTWHTCWESFHYRQSHWLRTRWNKLFMSMHAFFKCCVTLAHAHGTPGKLTVRILSPPLAAAFGEIVPVPSTIAHTSHNSGTPCNHIILCTDLLWNTLQAYPINPCLANTSLSRLLWHTHLTHSHLLQSAREMHACAEQFTSNMTIKLK